MTSPHLKAVIFDIGGVVLISPFLAIAAYEREYGIPHNYINCSIAAHGSHGAWQRFERGELPLFSFYEAFGHELSNTVDGNVWYKSYCKRKGIECPKLPETLHVDGRELFGRMVKGGGTFDEHILTAIHRIRAAGKWKIIALTNNFSVLDKASPDAADPSHIPISEIEYLGWEDGGPAPPHLRALFDDFCDSSEFGMRKPDPAFYLAACERNRIDPKEAVFLDDIWANLKTAQKLGMETIRESFLELILRYHPTTSASKDVRLGDSLSAVKNLEEKLGVDLTSPRKQIMCSTKL